MRVAHFTSASLPSDVRGAHLHTGGMRDRSQNVARDYLTLVIKETGLRGAQLARLIGVSASTINKPLNDPDVKHTLSLRTLLKIEEKTGIPIPDRLKIKQNQGSVRNGTDHIANFEKRVHDKLNYPIETGQFNLPLLGSVNSLTGELRIKDAASASFVERPSELLGRRNGYCVPMNDGSMYPVYRQGFPLYADPDRVPVEDDDVVIRFKDGHAEVRRLVGRVENGTTFRFFKPRESEVTYTDDEVFRIDMIVANGRMRI